MAENEIEKKPKNKPKNKPRGGNSPVIGNNGLNVEAGDNKKFLAVSLEVMNLPDIKVRNCTNQHLSGI